MHGRDGYVLRNRSTKQRKELTRGGREGPLFGVSDIGLPGHVESRELESDKLTLIYFPLEICRNAAAFSLRRHLLICEKPIATVGVRPATENFPHLTPPRR